MPHDRQHRKGSFATHLEDLVQHFPDKPTRRKAGDEPRKDKDGDDGCVHDRLFKAAWRRPKG